MGFNVWWRVFVARESGDPSKAKDCLPDKSKQFLVTRNGACHRDPWRRVSRRDSQVESERPVAFQNCEFDARARNKMVEPSS